MNYNSKKILKLKNGIRLLIIPLKTKLTKISVNILLGESHEKKNETELTHLLEHVFASFTSDKYKDSNEIKKELNKRGAKSNAYVSKYETSFYIEGLYDDIDYYIDLLSNTLNNLYIDKNIVNNEKNAVIQELNNYISESQYIFNMKVWRFMYFKYAYQYNYDKHIKFINEYNSDKLYDFYKKHIILKNIVISVTCPLYKRNITEKLLKKAFNFKNINKKYSLKYPIYHYINNNMKIIYINNKQSNNNTLLNIIVDKNIKKYSTKHICLNYLNYILFNFDTGVFYEILRRKLRLIYNINLNISIDSYNSKSSSYRIESNIITDKIPHLISNIIRIVENLKITDQDISAARNYLLIKNEYDKFYNLNTNEKYYNEFLLYKKPIIEKNNLINLYKNITNGQIYNELINFKKDILYNSLFFYYSNKNMNKKIKNVINKYNILYKIKYININ